MAIARSYICPKCGQNQWSIADKNYLVLFQICWSCDKQKWENKELSLEEFEEREKRAAQSEPL
jgi:hypothetical protein